MNIFGLFLLYSYSCVVLYALYGFLRSFFLPKERKTTTTEDVHGCQINLAMALTLHNESWHRDWPLHTCCQGWRWIELGACDQIATPVLLDINLSYEFYLGNKIFSDQSVWRCRFSDRIFIFSFIFFFSVCLLFDVKSDGCRWRPTQIQMCEHLEHHSVSFRFFFLFHIIIIRNSCDLLYIGFISIASD